MTIDIHCKVALPTARAQQSAALLAMEPKAAFLAVYDEIKAFLLADVAKNMDVDAHRVNYLSELMDITCTGGKYNRGITVVEVAKALSLGHVDAAQRVHEACVCGWAIEFLQAHFLIEDDIMDSSVTRRGKPCWYRHPGVTVQCAINDGLIVLAWCTRMLEKFLAGHRRLPQILSMFHDVDQKTTIGQLYDVSSMFASELLNPHVKQPTTSDYKEFTLAHYQRIVIFKTAYYTYHLPMLLGLEVAEQGHTTDAPEVEKLARVMGEYFQVQDDFLDCYGDPAKTGKIGTDIEDVKCSWLAVTFLAGAAAADAATFKANYGQHDAAKVAVIKKLFSDADLTGTFVKYEDGVVGKVEALLAAIATKNAGFSKAVECLWNRTFKRTI
jgi:farnesyl diphosphate synthase